uniref:Glycosyltransferase n=1 Tax=Fervidicoccus fontis TaxID=683846 RepID=A0A7J3SLF5_9CREN
MSTRILYIFGEKIHSAHKFEVLNAEIKPLTFNIFAMPTKPYQLVISEGFRPFFSGSIIKRVGLAKKHVNILMGDFILTSIYYKKILPLALFKMFISNCDGFITSSTFVANLFTNIFCIRKDKVKVVNPRANINQLLNLKRSMDLSKLNLLYLGHLTHLDGADLLPEIFKNVRKDFPSLKFFVIGRGTLLSELLKAGKSLNGFYVLGYRSYAYVEEVLRNCLIFVYPARMKAFGLPVMESMAAGLIPVVTERTGAKDLVELVNPDLIVQVDIDKIARKIIEVLGMPNRELIELSEKARRVAFEAYKSAPQKFINAMKVFLKE